jgi:hypothetical protein
MTRTGGVLDHLHAQRVDVQMGGPDVRELPRPPRSVLPEVPHEAHRVEFVGHDDPLAALPASELGVAHDPLHSLSGRDVLLNGDLIGGALLQVSARPDVGALGVLAKHHEVDVRRAEPLQGAEPVVQAADRPIVDVEVQAEARAEEDVGRVLHVGYAGVAEGPHEHGVVMAREVLEGAGGDGLPRLQVVVGAPGKVHRLDRDPSETADASRTLSASAVTSTPIPSPGTTAIRMSRRKIAWGIASRLSS